MAYVSAFQKSIETGKFNKILIPFLKKTRTFFQTYFLKSLEILQIIFWKGRKLFLVFKSFHHCDNVTESFLLFTIL